MRNEIVYCEKGDGVANEDVCGHFGQFAWVIDGATDVFKRNCLFEENEVCNYVNYLNNAIKNHAGNYKPAQLVELVKDVVSAVYHELEIEEKANDVPEYMLPTYAMALVAADGEKLYYFILGDCFIGYQSEKGIEMLIDDRISKFSKHNRMLLKEYYERTKQMPDSMTIYQETRTKANALDGYPIGSVYGTGIPNAVTGTISLPFGQKFIICSDGFLDYFRSNCAKNENFFSINSLFDEIDAMKKFLADEKQYYTDIRPKKLDDCSLMLMEV